MTPHIYFYFRLSNNKQFDNGVSSFSDFNFRNPPPSPHHHVAPVWIRHSHRQKSAGKWCGSFYYQFVCLPHGNGTYLRGEVGGGMVQRWSRWSMILVSEGQAAITQWNLVFFFYLFLVCFINYILTIMTLLWYMLQFSITFLGWFTQRSDIIN